ncbi:kinase-like protein [Auriscalpium vulgare]|uniref:Kinase-like protein n=1 Tax=Auriscalpium vulgare TaxID=40419 RepID=A0ACB8R9Y6_9AGAM|nr:kinase-like protein [Auriscalpium vulgare]
MQFTRRLPVLRRLFASVTQSTKTGYAPQPPATPTWVEDEEPLEGYDSHIGYLPVAIGDVLGSRYIIKRKLGWGICSTVWLALQQNSSPPAFSALKILNTATSADQKLHELEFLQVIRDKNGQHPGHAHNLQLLDHFYHDASEGRHLCLVTEPLLQNLSSYVLRWPYHAIPMALLKRVTRQTLLALDYLHTECNIIHTDVKPSNILFVPPRGPTSLFALAAASAQPNRTSVGLDRSGRSITYTESDNLMYPMPEEPHAPEAWRDVQIKLTDVGVSCWADNVSGHYSDIISSPALRAPEVCVGAGWGRPADIWSLGCTIYELYMGLPLFPAGIREELYPTIHIDLLGKYPSELVKGGKYSSSFFNADGSLKNVLPGLPNVTLEQRLRQRHDADDLFVDFMIRILILDPARRPTCQELLAHEWVRFDQE